MTIRLRKGAINWGGAGWAKAAAKPAKKKAKPQLRPSRPAPPLHVVEDALAAIGAPAGQRIVCDYPPSILSPNRRPNRWDKSKAARLYRQDCHILALAAKVTLPAEGKIAVRLDFFPLTAIAPDDDNAISSFKAGRDGIADALRINDKRFEITPQIHAQPLGCVVVTFEQVAG